MMTKEEVQKRIEAGLKCDYILVSGDDGRHFDAIVVSAAFEGLGKLKQHKLVYETLGDAMQTDEIHALSVHTYTPTDWERVHAL
ncbi:BolA/IbaG family iron-sulfur metabolism protein [Wohlfahrtiimonas chitiniclastica]|uniref:BolA family transcriptional regulator n=2 Tax=Wohlfahrtiimonas chitiniclastica TaxID=400946 RepID=L8XX10_9GAMM|nr:MULTISPECIES: BolA/IbaG family iron-sulfur metabolism protein [Wohlfahrtiimonas]ELV07300.1 Hypothetical protein F387_01850 [Wohlfahrtiimonas chitiniclastica SH04]KZS23985.1 hypothetical protein BMY_1859 [Wohlfahrtiimonas chitiniclastica]KZX36754.1 BolA family transcriptional regulator [Wohlfahrtiimonas chitiniclastica]MBS7815544.1 BolA/IbaG family iron-sulfur metabolism protein [Wohlfahrtiimonas chitiniclastica]MBS7816651.1 BolA/IbaG family iron-sulfur metabolism protein [Wohlfahrtiimonas c